MQDFELTIPQPDPAWEYSHIWNQVHEAKKQLEQAIATLAKLESINDDANNELFKLFVSAGSLALNCANLTKRFYNLEEFLED